MVFVLIFLFGFLVGIVFAFASIISGIIQIKGGKDEDEN